MKPLINISFSGGRTSAYMAKMMIDRWSDKYDFVTTFANTGLEHEKTLSFVNSCDMLFGLDVVWLEAVVHPEKGEGTTYKQVDYLTASRKGEPMEAVIAKYGLPNQNYPHCTRETKLQPMVDYMRRYSDFKIALGIRADESRRVKKNPGNIIYPLVDVWPTTKQEVLSFWQDQGFDLGLCEYQGNCGGCFKKSYKKHYMQIEDDPKVFDFWRRMEQQYPSEDRNIFRGQLTTSGLFEQHEELKQSERAKQIIFETADEGGCSESCELFEME